MSQQTCNDQQSSDEIKYEIKYENDTQGHQQPFKPGARLYVAFGGLLAMTLVVALDATTVSVALPTIAKHLNASAIEAFWTGTSYLLSSTVFQPSYGSLSYIFGRKAMILAALCFFAVGAVVCGTAHRCSILLFGRTIQGVGGAGLIAMTEVVLTDLIPLKERGTYTGVLASMYALGGGVGPIVGGALASVAWRWIFWINLPLIGVAFVMIISFLPLRSKSSSAISKLQRIDWIGSALFIGSTTAILIPVTWGGVQEPWKSLRTLVPLCIGVAGVVVFALFDVRFAKEPLIPRQIFPNRSANLGYLSSCLQGLGSYALVYYLPLYFEGIQDYSTTIAGVAMLAFTAGIAPSAAFTGFLITKSGRYRWAIWLGWTISVIGCAVLLLLSRKTSIAAEIFLVLFGAIGNGMLAPATQFQVQASQSNQEKVGLALAMYGFFRSLGQSFGVAIGGVLFQNRIHVDLVQSGIPSRTAMQYSKDATELVFILRAEANSPQKLTLRHGFMSGLAAVWILVAVVSGIALALSTLVKAYAIDVQLQTDHGLVATNGSRSEQRREGHV